MHSENYLPPVSEVFMISCEQGFAQSGTGGVDDMGHGGGIFG